jgi:transposase
MENQGSCPQLSPSMNSKAIRAEKNINVSSQTRYSHQLTGYFSQLDRSQTKHFVSDMWSTYANIAQTYFKNATYVIDKYHYIRQIFWAFEAVQIPLSAAKTGNRHHALCQQSPADRLFLERTVS